MNTMTIENRKIGDGFKTFIIAEGCDNHMGNLDAAKEMCRQAKLAGADCIKFQHHLPDEEMLKEVPMSSNFEMPLYDFLKLHALTLDQHIELMNYCKEIGILYLCTPFSLKAAYELDEIGVSAFKIGSGEMTDIPTIKAIAKLGKPMIVSTGMSTLEEIERTYKLSEFERKYSDYEFICGIDEVGRGPLAGPVVAGAVILPKDCDILYINDSKKLSAKKREELYEVIMEKAVCAKTAVVSPKVIDEINILQATYEAMRQAISMLEPQPTLLLNDAVNIPGVPMKQVSIIKGDAKSISIGAASIIAKVTRDAMMVEYDKIYPEYDFASNKGYGSAKHIEALKKYGPCPIHRKSFIHNFI